MKKTELKEVKILSVNDLSKKVKEAKKQLADIVMERSQLAAKGSKDVKSFFKKRKDIAQMMTILRQKELLSELESKVKS